MKGVENMVGWGYNKLLHVPETLVVDSLLPTQHQFPPDSFLTKSVLFRPHLLPMKPCASAEAGTTPHAGLGADWLAWEWCQPLTSGWLGIGYEPSCGQWEMKGGLMQGFFSSSVSCEVWLWCLKPLLLPSCYPAWGWSQHTKESRAWRWKEPGSSPISLTPWSKTTWSGPYEWISCIVREYIFPLSESQFLLLAAKSILTDTADLKGWGQITKSLESGHNKGWGIQPLIIKRLDIINRGVTF